MVNALQESVPAPVALAERARSRVETLAMQRIAEHCPYAYYFKDVSVRCRGEVLILEGRLPTFYLKQVLQTLLRDIDGVERIDNRCDVVSSVGLSSVRAK